MAIKKGEKLLEVGCGRGVLLDRLVVEYGVRTFGIDIAERAIAEAKKEAVHKHDLRVADACHLPFSDSFFDVVLSLDALEHIKSPISAEASAGGQEKAVSEMVRVLKKGGRILIYTINSRQAFTWNRLLHCLGVDVYQSVDHDPKLFVDPDWLKSELEGKEVAILGIDYFNSFFTLATDEAIMVFLSLWQRFFGWEKTEKFAKIGLIFFTLTSLILTPMLHFLELPWRFFGYSNGFLILGEKRK